MTCENAENKVKLSPFNQAMTRRLSPFSCEAESNSDKAKADNHVPSADTWDWIESLGHIEDNDPEEADQEIGDHYRGQPAWAFERPMWLSIVNQLIVSVALLDLFTQFRLWHG
jgi:hypothetical protein